MKKAILIRAFFFRNKMASILISLLIFVSVFVVCWIQGLCSYRMRYIDILEKYMDGGDLFMQWENSEYTQEVIKNTISEVSRMPGVDMVLYNVVTIWTDENGNFYRVYYCSSEMKSRVELGTEIQEYNGRDSIECVASYGLAEKGDTLRLHKMYKKEEISLEFQVKGTTNEDFLYPVFTSSSDGVLTSSELLETVNVLFVTGEAFLEYLEMSELPYEINCYVLYQKGATEKEIEDVRSIAEQQGGYQKIEDVLKNSQKYEIDEIKHILLIPVTILMVITFASCAIILLIMQEKMQEYAIYFLCGCSKRRIAMICFASLSTIVFIPCIINLLIILFHKKISNLFGISFGTVLYSGNQMLFTVVYLLAVLLITGMIELIMIAGMSPVEMYRRITR